MIVTSLLCLVCLAAIEFLPELLAMLGIAYSHGAIGGAAAEGGFLIPVVQYGWPILLALLLFLRQTARGNLGAGWAFWVDLCSLLILVGYSVWRWFNGYSIFGGGTFFAHLFLLAILVFSTIHSIAGLVDREDYDAYGGRRLG